MDERFVKSFTKKSVGFLLIVALITLTYTLYQEVMIQTVDNRQEEIFSQTSKLYLEDRHFLYVDNALEGMGDTSGNRTVSRSWEEMSGDNYLIIKKPKQNTFSIKLEDLYMTRSIKITIEDLEERYFTEESVKSHLKGVLSSTEISYDYNAAKSTYTATFYVTLDQIYVHEVFEDSEHTYISLEDPHEVYDRIVVVDVGHGGNDIGTYSANMVYYEKNINLDIALYLKELLDKEDMKVYYTRLKDEKVYLNPRLNLANDLNADLFISIHCNGDESNQPNGSEVLYTENVKTKGFSSKKLATICLEELLAVTQTKNRGIVESSEIHIVGNANVPVALVEVGFMSNEKDMNFLKEEENLKKAALGIFNGIKKAYEELEKDEE